MQDTEGLEFEILKLIEGLSDTEKTDILAKAHSKIPKPNGRKIGRLVLEKLADSQISRLEKVFGRQAFSVTNLILNDLLNTKKELIDIVSKMYIEEGNTPFIPATSRVLLGIEDQVDIYNSLINPREAKMRIYSGIINEHLEDIVEVPAKAYWMVNVSNEPRYYTNNVYLPDEIAEIKKSLRQRLTIAEALAIHMHTHPPNNCWTHASGTEHIINGRLLTTIIRGKGMIMIVPTHNINRGEYISIPSCSLRF